MKQPKIITFALLGMLFLASCHKDKDPEPLPQLSVEPAPVQIAFTASDTKTYTYRVTTNQSAWKADSDREWCVVTPDYAAGTFTVTARLNDATTPSPAATITVSAGEAAPLIFTATQEAAQYEVYVCGRYHTGSNNPFGCYWKDGEFFPLSAPHEYVAVSTEMIAVDNGSVYVLGNYYDGNDRYYGHWKDGNFAPLEADPQNDYIWAFGFADGSVYFGGRTHLNGAAKVCYWKDGTQKILTESDEDYDIREIAVSGDKVYLAGAHLVGNLSRVCYWVNGEFIQLGEPGDMDETGAYGIALSNGRVCVLGPAVDNKAQLWIDGKKQEYGFPQGARFPFAEALCTAPDGALYIQGKYYEPGNRYSVCWWDEKGNRTDLKNIYKVSGIAAAGGAVYVAGLFSDRRTPCYWKDGERFDLSVPDDIHEVDIENICVVKK